MGMKTSPIERKNCIVSSLWVSHVDKAMLRHDDHVDDSSSPPGEEKSEILRLNSFCDMVDEYRVEFQVKHHSQLVNILRWSPWNISSFGVRTYISVWSDFSWNHHVFNLHKTDKGSWIKYYNYLLYTKTDKLK